MGLFSFSFSCLVWYRVFLWDYFIYDLLEDNVLSPWVGNLLHLSQQQSVLLIKKQVLMALTESLIHQALAKELVEKMMVGGGEGEWTAFCETWNNNRKSKKIINCLFLKVLLVWNTGLEKRILNWWLHVLGIQMNFVSTASFIKEWSLQQGTDGSSEWTDDYAKRILCLETHIIDIWVKLLEGHLWKTRPSSLLYTWIQWEIREWLKAISCILQSCLLGINWKIIWK